MRRGKLVAFILIVVLIILVQPNVYPTIKHIIYPKSFEEQITTNNNVESDKTLNKELVKEKYSGTQVIKVNNNVPTFTKGELTLNGKDHWKKFSNLDILNRVGTAETLISVKSLPTKSRGDISNIKPTGFKQKKITFNGKSDYLYNRCHLIAFELSGENDNPKNLFTGTRALNANDNNRQQSMVYYEDMIKNYVKQTNHHVLYQVTPIFSGVDLVAKGVRLQGRSIEDNQISFNVYIFNVQPGYQINYLTGKSIKEK